MILSSNCIRQKIEEKEIEIHPIMPIQFQPASIDLCLGNEFLILDEFETPILNMEDEATYRKVNVKDSQSIIIPPQHFYLQRQKKQLNLVID